MTCLHEKLNAGISLAMSLNYDEKVSSDRRDCFGEKFTPHYLRFVYNVH
jgi:hypothetical protein